MPGRTKPGKLLPAFSTSPGTMLPVPAITLPSGRPGAGTFTPVPPVRDNLAVNVAPKKQSGIIDTVIPPKQPMVTEQYVLPKLNVKTSLPIPQRDTSVVAAAVESAASKPSNFKVNWRDFGSSGYGTLPDKNGKRFNYEIALVPPPGDPNRKYYSPFNEVQLFKNGKKVGRLEWSEKTGEILMVEVDKGYQRQGLATQMLRLANQAQQKFPHVQPPQHSRDRTKEGDEWAQSVGGTLPPLYGTKQSDIAERAAMDRRIAIMNLRKPNPSEAEIADEIKRMYARLGR